MTHDHCMANTSSLVSGHLHAVLLALDITEHFLFLKVLCSLGLRDTWPSWSPLPHSPLLLLSLLAGSFSTPDPLILGISRLSPGTSYQSTLTASLVPCCLPHALSNSLIGSPQIVPGWTTPLNSRFTCPSSLRFLMGILKVTHPKLKSWPIATQTSSFPSPPISGEVDCSFVLPDPWAKPFGVILDSSFFHKLHPVGQERLSQSICKIQSLFPVHVVWVTDHLSWSMENTSSSPSFHLYSLHSVLNPAFQVT